jgi:hypothetical protein
MIQKRIIEKADPQKSSKKSNQKLHPQKPIKKEFRTPTH